MSKTKEVIQVYRIFGIDGVLYLSLYRQMKIILKYSVLSRSLMSRKPGPTSYISYADRKSEYGKSEYDAIPYLKQVTSLTVTCHH